MELFFWGIVISLAYIGLDIYRGRKNLEKEKVESKTKKIWSDIKNESLKGWIMGFLLMMLILFTMRGLVLIEHQAQTCEIWDAKSSSNMEVLMSANKDNVRLIKGTDSFGMETGRSWGYYLKNVNEIYDGYKPEDMSIVCHWEIKNTLGNLKLAWKERNVHLPKRSIYDTYGTLDLSKGLVNDFQKDLNSSSGNE